MAAQLVLTALRACRRFGPAPTLPTWPAPRSRIALRDGDILVLAQKIVSKAEGRFARLVRVQPSARAQALAAEVGKDPRVVELILRESSEVVRRRPGVIVVAHRLGFVLGNAGIDASNVEGEDGEEVLLLPENPDASAAHLRERLRASATRRGSASATATLQRTSCAAPVCAEAHASPSSRPSSTAVWASPPACRP